MIEADRTASAPGTTRALLALALAGVFAAILAPAARAAPASEPREPVLLSQPPVIHSIDVHASNGTQVTTLAPGDTFLVDVIVSDPDGFADVSKVDVSLGYQDLSGLGNPAFGARFEWRPTVNPAFQKTSNTSSWAIVASRCSVDVAAPPAAPHLVRFAIVAGAIARASASGEWRIQATMPSAPPLTQLGFGMAERVALSEVSASAQFEAAAAGAKDVPLQSPATGAIRMAVLSNAPWRPTVAGRRFVGQMNPAVSIRVAKADTTLRWSLTAGSLTASGVLDSVLSDLTAARPASEQETPEVWDVAMWMRYPGGIQQQSYLGALDLRLRTALGEDSAAALIPATAVIASGGMAASAAVAEITPIQVTAGTGAVAFTAYVQPSFGGGATGVDLIRIGLPIGYGAPVVTGARVLGFPVAFTDQSDAVTAVAQLGSAVSLSVPIQIQFTVSAPTRADPVAGRFGVVVDDSRTPLPGILADPGNVDFLVASDQLDVLVVPGPVASLGLTPDAVATQVDSLVPFAVTPADAYGNPVSSAVTWGVLGGIGTVNSSGLFRATTVGLGRVVARGGAVAETASVEVLPNGLGLRVRPVSGGPATLLPGAARKEIARYRVVNSTLTRDTLIGLTLDDASTGPGTLAQMDASWALVDLVPVKIGNDLSSGDPAAAAWFASGQAVLGPMAIAVGARDSIELVVRSGASLAARDGDRLAVSIAGPAAVAFASGRTCLDPGPYAAGAGSVVDGMTAAQIAVSMPGRGLMVGARRQPVLGIRVPANGYAADVLNRINLIGDGDARPGADLTALEAWLDDGDAAFDSSADTPLGFLVFTGDRWEITGLSLAVPPGGALLFVSANLAETAEQGRTLHLDLPSLPDVALGMASGNSGPVDAVVESPGSLVISIADRMTLADVPLAGGTVAPGARDVPLLALDVRNTYAAPRQLASLAVQNAVAGPGSLAERDAEIAQLELRADGDGDGLLGDEASDPVLAAATLAGGRAAFGGLTLDIAPGATLRLFVTGRVSLLGAADGDRLAVSVASAFDVGFSPPSALAAEWPLASTGAPVVDGMVAAQIGNPGAPGATLGPGDGPIAVLDVNVPRNGYRDDVLQGVRVTNLGTATASDLAGLRLWRDGGDAAFDAGAGDDRDLGPLAAIGNEWRSPILAEALGTGGARLFVAATIGASPADSSTLRLAIPPDGLATTSGNGGPRDGAVENPGEMLLSTAPLLATFRVTPAASVIGQSVIARLTVRNVSSERVLAIAPALGAAEGDGTLTPLAGPLPATLALDPGAENLFEWTFRADTAGTVRLLAGVEGSGESSGLPRRSLQARSDFHRIYVAAGDVDMFAVQSMPFAVERGQSGVVPLSLTFAHPGAADASDIALERITVRLEGETGAPIVPASLLARVAVVEGGTTYLERTTLEPAGSTVTLDLTTPVLVRPDDPVTVALLLDVDSLTTVPDFRLVIDDSTGFAARDATSGAPIRVRLSGASYPVRSGLARIVSGVEELLASAPAADTAHWTRGEAGLRLGTIRLANGADPVFGTEARVGALRLDVADAAGASRHDLDRAFSRIVVRSALGTHLDRALVAADSAALALTLLSVVPIPAGAALDLDLFADVRADAPTGCYEAAVRDSQWIEARDAGSGEPVPARLSATPLRGGPRFVERPADSARVAGRPLFPGTTGAGRTALDAIGIRLRHPGAADQSALRLDSLVVTVVDRTRAPLAPGAYLDRLVVRRAGAAIANLTGLAATPEAVRVPLPPVALAPGASDSLTVTVDVSAAASGNTIELLIEGAGVALVEANRGTPVTIAAEAGAMLPLTSGSLVIEQPSRRLTAGLASRLPAVLPADLSETVAGVLSLENTAAAGSGPIDVASLRLVADDGAGHALAIGAVLSDARVEVGGLPWAASGALTADSAAATLAAPAPTTIAAATRVPFEIRVRARPEAAGTRFRIGLDRADIGVIQPASPLLSIAIEAEDGSLFPLWTETGAVAAAGIEASYANFPNPFAAGREPTTFVFALERPARVTLKIWTLRGELVRTLLDGASLGAGLRQSDRWDGRNGRGTLVANGVYVAELVVDADGGGSSRVLRKVAVLR